MSFIAADIGGTNSRFAFIAAEGQAANICQFSNADFSSFDELLEQLSASCNAGQTRIEAIVLALPAPIDNPDEIKLTNIRWRVSKRAIQQRFPDARVLLINDFQAAAIGVLLQPAEELLVLNPAAVDRQQPVVVTGAGTGLGLAWLPEWDLQRLPVATEGGHVDFAPGSEQQRQLQIHLGKQYGHVSCERLLSGPGLASIYAFLSGHGTNAITAAQVHQLALQQDEHALASIHEFVRIFGAYAGNLALQFNPAGGIYLCGGVAAKLADWFLENDFIDAYLDKGRMRHKVKTIPVFLTRQEDTGLTGAMHIASNQVRKAS
ncbi:MAG: ROK family protein [Chromatiales bacterium]|jgi:glucokinase